VLLWAREPEVVADINAVHENRTFLPGISLARGVIATADLAEMSACEAVLVVTPAQHLRSTLARLPQVAVPLILCAKGIEEATAKLMHEVAAEEQPGAPIAVLSGPTFAHEVAIGCPRRSRWPSRIGGLANASSPASPARRSGLISRTTSPARRSAGRSRTSSPSLVGSWTASASARMRAPRSSHAVSPR
jgi:hypothetical protein